MAGRIGVLAERGPAFESLLRELYQPEPAGEARSGYLAGPDRDRPHRVALAPLGADVAAAVAALTSAFPDLERVVLLTADAGEGVAVIAAGAGVRRPDPRLVRAAGDLDGIAVRYVHDAGAVAESFAAAVTAAGAAWFVLGGPGAAALLCRLLTRVEP